MDTVRWRIFIVAAVVIVAVIVVALSRNTPPQPTQTAYLSAQDDDFDMGEFLDDTLDVDDWIVVPFMSKGVYKPQKGMQKPGPREKPAKSGLIPQPTTPQKVIKSRGSAGNKSATKIGKTTSKPVWRKTTIPKTRSTYRPSYRSYGRRY